MMGIELKLDAIDNIKYSKGYEYHNSDSNKHSDNHKSWGGVALGIEIGKQSQDEVGNP